MRGTVAKRLRQAANEMAAAKGETTSKKNYNGMTYYWKRNCAMWFYRQLKKFYTLKRGLAVK